MVTLEFAGNKSRLSGFSECRAGWRYGSGSPGVCSMRLRAVS